MKSISKVVLFAYLGEKIFETLGNKTEQYPKIREALDFILDYLKNNQIYEEKVYECLDDEDEDDLVGYMIYAKDEMEKKKLSAILQIVSYISNYILRINQLPIPQFLLESDDESYDAILNDILELNIISGNRESLLKNIDCYFDKFSENDSFEKQKEGLENYLI